VHAPEPVRSDSAPRERKWRDEDRGPSVAGFGGEIPAFMMLPKRATRGHAAESHEQDEAA
jgi:hypothetical protein